MYVCVWMKAWFVVPVGWAFSFHLVKAKNWICVSKISSNSALLRLPICFILQDLQTQNYLSQKERLSKPISGRLWTFKQQTHIH